MFFLLDFRNVQTPVLYSNFNPSFASTSAESIINPQSTNQFGFDPQQPENGEYYIKDLLLTININKKRNLVQEI